jgi:hypothetical protein
MEFKKCFRVRGHNCHKARVEKYDRTELSSAYQNVLCSKTRNILRPVTRIISVLELRNG